MNFIRYILKRILFAIPMLLAVTVIVFLLVRFLPGDPAVTYAGPMASPEQVEALRERMGWNEPLFVQYVNYMKGLFKGDLGISLFTSNPVLTDIKQRFPATLEIIIYGLFFAFIIGVPLGMITGAKGKGVIDWIADKLTYAYSLLAGALPDFWWALMMVFVFYFVLRIAPAPTGRISMMINPPTKITGLYTIDSLLTGNYEAFRSSVRHLVLPVSTMAFLILGPVMRLTRESMNEALNSNYVRFARQCGIVGWRVSMYALRNSLTTVITVAGIYFCYELGAAVLIENVFAWGGLGQYAVNSVSLSDYFAFQGVMLTITVFSMFIYLIVDLLYAAVDPRVTLD